MPKSTSASTEKAKAKAAAKAKRQALKASRIAAAATVELSDVLPVGSLPPTVNAKQAAIDAGNAVLESGGTTDDAIDAANAVLSSAVLGGIKRDNDGITRAATSYGATSERDESYLAMLASFGRDTVTLADIRKAYAKNPFYTGSAKSTDVGAFVRLSKAGYIDFADGAATFTVTTDDDGIEHPTAREYAARCLSVRAPADVS